MKYMGSKEWMLGNSLGEILDEEVVDKTRFVDLFAGAGAVSWRMAEKHKVAVKSVDLQQYSKVLCEAVTGRTKPASRKSLSDWFAASREEALKAQLKLALDELGEKPLRNVDVAKARKTCAGHVSDGPVWNAYGGHYFSPKQALAFDSLLKNLPTGRNSSTLLAALLTAATRCAASPGHLAQPLQPGKRTNGYLDYYWRKDVFEVTKKAFNELAPRFAHVEGDAIVGDAVAFTENISENDLVFVDPPYTGVHYSRFYHVLETMAKRSKPIVSGVGRYPAPAERPRSDFSVTTESKTAVETLLSKLAARKATVVFTFPAGVCSNGLSGMFVRNAARRHFDVSQHAVSSRFSTLGGRSSDRNPRKDRKELVLTLRPAR